MVAKIHSAIDFYERHPISVEIILSKLSASRGHLNHITPDELFPHDQDHYGELLANDALAASLTFARVLEVRPATWLINTAPTSRA